VTGNGTLTKLAWEMGAENGTFTENGTFLVEGWSGTREEHANARESRVPRGNSSRPRFHCNSI